MSDVLDIVRAQRPDRPALDSATRRRLRAQVTGEPDLDAPATIEALAGSVRVRPEGDVDEAAVPRDGVHGRDRRWLQAAAASLVILGSAGLWFAGTDRDAEEPSAPATQPRTSAIGTGNPGAGTIPVQGERSPTLSRDPTSFPVLDDLPDGPTATAHVHQIAEGVSTPYTHTLIGRLVDGTLIDAVSIVVDDIPFDTSRTAGQNATDAVVFGQPAIVIDRTDAQDGQVFVRWGSGPYFVAFGDDPLAFLNQVGTHVISATPGVGATEAPQLDIGTLPDGFDVIVRPQAVGQATRTATLSVGTGNYDIEVSTHNPVIDMAISGRLQAIQVNGRPGWAIPSTDRYQQGITWQVDDSTYAYLRVIDGRSNAEALDLAERITFVDYDAWAARYLPETFTVTPTTAPPFTSTSPLDGLDPLEAARRVSLGARIDPTPDERADLDVARQIMVRDCLRDGGATPPVLTSADHDAVRDRALDALRFLIRLSTTEGLETSRFEGFLPDGAVVLPGGGSPDALLLSVSEGSLEAQLLEGGCALADEPLRSGPVEQELNRLRPIEIDGEMTESRWADSALSPSQLPEFADQFPAVQACMSEAGYPHFFDPSADTNPFVEFRVEPGVTEEELELANAHADCVVSTNFTAAYVNTVSAVLDEFDEEYQAELIALRAERDVALERARTILTDHDIEPFTT